MLLSYRECAGSIREYGIAIFVLLAWVTFQPISVHAETIIIPSLKFSEMYDTNIWFAPAELLPPGTRLDDFATSLGGRLEALYKEREIEASLAGGLDFNTYAYNTGLNYINTRVDAKAKLDSWLQRLAKGAQLRVADTFRYTPESPSFFTGVRPGVVEDPFLRGIQSFRANTFANTGSVNVLYPIFRDISVDGRYSNSIIRVGSVLAASATGATFFDTTINTFAVGPQYKLTRIDSLTLSFERSQISQTVATGGAPLETTTQSVITNYLRVGRDWQFGVSGGVTHVSQGDKAFPVGSIKLNTNPERVTGLRLSLSRMAGPSFFFVPGALISNVGQLAVSHRLSRLLTVQGNVNYGLNESVPPGVKFTNFAAGMSLNYRLTKIFVLDLFYNYSDFHFDATTLKYEVPRNVVGFSVTAEWR
jgi:hypothetical protein